MGAGALQAVKATDEFVTKEQVKALPDVMAFDYGAAGVDGKFDVYAKQHPPSPDGVPVMTKTQVSLPRLRTHNRHDCRLNRLPTCVGERLRGLLEGHEARGVHALRAGREDAQRNAAARG